MRQLHINAGELTAKAHERGFDSLAEVNEVKMAPNGSLIFTGQESDSGGSRHRELLERLDALQREVAQLGRRL